MNDVITIDERVPLDHEVSKHLMKDQTRPVLFKDLNGSRAVGNLWSDRERVASSLMIDKKDLIKKMLQAMSSPMSPSEVDEAPFMEKRSDRFRSDRTSDTKIFSWRCGTLHNGRGSRRGT